MTPASRLTAVFAVLAIVGLLLAFDRVVRDGVREGGQRKAAVQARADANWRCGLLAAARARTECRQGLD